MSKSKRKIDPNQGSFNFGMVEDYIEVKEEILHSVALPVQPVDGCECEYEACVLLAAAVNQAYRDAGISREQLCDGINEYFGRTPERYKEKQCRKPLSYNMMNNMLSKPAENPMDAYLLFAIHHVCRSLGPARLFANAEGAKIATREEVKLIALGKLDRTIAEMKDLQRELKER